VPITLSSKAFRRTGLAGASLALSLVVAACGANFGAQTTKPYQPAEGTNADSGSIAVRNMLVLADEEGKGELHAGIVNKGDQDDTLVSIASAPSTEPNGQDPATVTFGNVKPVELKSNQLVTLPPAEGQPITVTGAKPGDIINVTLTFGKAGPITTAIPVLTLDHYSPSPRPDAESEG
jgi:copper(I)-binding protein